MKRSTGRDAFCFLQARNIGKMIRGTDPTGSRKVAQWRDVSLSSDQPDVLLPAISTKQIAQRAGEDSRADFDQFVWKIIIRRMQAGVPGARPQEKHCGL